MDTATDGTDSRVETRVEADPAFDALFDSQFDTMTWLAYLLGADDPEDIAQESFVRLYGRWHTLSGTGKASAYLRRIVVNLSRSRLRHLRIVRRTTTDRLPDAASAETHVLAGHEHRRLREALAGLPTRQRQVLVLRYWLDLDQNAIAETLGIAVGTVKATNSHAIANLRKVWPEQEEH